MDIDAMRLFKELTEEEKKKLMANNACFYCQKPGHRAKDCRSKKWDEQRKSNQGRTGNRTSSRTTEVKATNDSDDLIDLSTVTGDDIVNALKSEAFLCLEDDEKLGIIEKIAPQGF